MNRARDKYRVWDEEKKEYVSSRVFINHHGETCLIRHGGFYPNKCTKEHCTGVKDKNGKLIYEGDVLKVPAFLGGVVNMRVVWDDNSCRWNLDYSGKRSTEKDMTVLVPELGNASEIIGNIHEMEIDK